MSYTTRISQVAGHLNYPKGLLAGQVAIITGSGQGIGAECARLFANEGAKVVVNDIDESTFEKITQLCSLYTSSHAGGSCLRSFPRWEGACFQPT